jgi:dCMP deaminase
VSEKVRDILGLTNVPIDQIRIGRKKIAWDHFFLLEARLWSLRSHDPQTQCGCVLVGRDKTVISTGYNGFIADIDDESFPNLRPYKHPFMIHAEHNAILHCARNGIKSSGATAYVTGKPCNNCLQFLWQAGIYDIVYSDISMPKMIENDEYTRVQNAIFYVTEGKLTFKFIPSKDFL